MLKLLTLPIWLPFWALGKLVKAIATTRVAFGRRP